MKQKQMIISKIADNIFYLGIIIEVLLVIIDKSAYTNPIEGRVFQLTFVLFLIKVCMTKYSWKEYLFIFLSCLLGTVSYFATGRNEIIRFVMFMAACKDIDMQKCLKLVYYMTVAGCMVIVLLSVTGVYGAISLTQDYGRGGEETRYTLGMGHPNALQCMVWALTTLGLYLYAEKMKWYHYFPLIIVNLFFFKLTVSKTSLIVTLFIIALAFLATRENQLCWRKVVGCLSITVTLLSIIFSVVIACNAYRVYNYAWNIERSPITTIFAKLNDILNGRIRILVENDRFEGTISTWSIFSKPENTYFFDMGWIRLFYWYGILPACIFIIFLIIVMIFCYKKQQYLALIMIASFAVYSVIEAHAISVYLARNYVLFLLGQYWYQILCLKTRKRMY